jgi:stage III sporulation protein AB
MIGITMSSKLSKRASELELLLVLIEKIQTYLRYKRSPTNQLIEELSEYDMFSPFKFLKDCKKMLESSLDFPTAWKNGVLQNQYNMNLVPGDISIVCSLSDILGATDVDGQLSALDLTSSLLKQSLKEAQDKKASHGKLYRSLGVLAGVGVAIIIF